MKKTTNLLKIVSLFGLSFFLLSSSGSCGGEETNTTKNKNLSSNMNESIAKIKESFKDADSSFGIEDIERDDIDPILNGFFNKEDGTYIKDSDSFSDDFPLEDLEDEEERPKNRDELIKILKRRREAADLLIRDVEVKVNRLLDEGKSQEAQDLIDKTTKATKRYTLLVSEVNNVIYEKKEEQNPNSGNSRKGNGSSSSSKGGGGSSSTSSYVPPQPPDKKTTFKTNHFDPDRNWNAVKQEVKTLIEK